MRRPATSIGFISGGIRTPSPAKPEAAGRVPGPGSARLVVDLGALEPAREVDVDRLPLGIRVERDVARLAMAVAGLLPATERQVHLGAGRPGVDVDDPRFEVAHRPERLVDVAGEDA